MSDFVLYKGKRSADCFARHYGVASEKVKFAPTKDTCVTLADGRDGVGSCLGCSHAPCIEKHPSEHSLPAGLESYPGDPSESVCPTRAITWDEVGQVAAIDMNACIGCGLCATRCPYGAIYLTALGKAKVQISDPDCLVVSGPINGPHAKPEREGLIATAKSIAAQNLLTAVSTLSDTDAMRLVRNVLHELGINARIRRRGDTNMRIDAVGYTRSERPFVAEIEFSGSVLESPRALLEDVAIMHARYGFAVEDIDALSIILAFPNVRSEYYQVIRDIEKVLGIRCRNLTLGAMIALIWNFTEVDSFDGDDFAVLGEGIDLAESTGLVGFDEPYPGAFKPVK